MKRYNIMACPACGKRHQVELDLLEEPLLADGLKWTHSYICPQAKVTVYGLFREVVGKQQVMLRP